MTAQLAEPKAAGRHEYPNIYVCFSNIRLLLLILAGHYIRLHRLSLNITATNITSITAHYCDCKRPGPPPLQPAARWKRCSCSLITQELLFIYYYYQNITYILLLQCKMGLVVSS